MPEVALSVGSHESRVVRSGDAALSLHELVHKLPPMPKGRVLRPLVRLCGCVARVLTSDCAAPTAHDDRETEGEYRARIAKGREIEVLVVCSPIEGYDFYGAAGRMWPRGESRVRLHPDEIAELKQETYRISVLTVAEIHSRALVPEGMDAITYFEEQLAKARAAKAASAQAAGAPNTQTELTPEVAAMPPAPAAPGASTTAKPKK